MSLPSHRHPMDELRVAVVGAGTVGTGLGRDAAELDGVAVVALADVDADARERAGHALSVPESSRYEEHDDLYDGEDIDAVVVATPHTLHYEQVRDALARGLHVLCEKPLVTDVARARDLRDRADESDAVLMVGYQRHVDPVFETARSFLADAPAPTMLTAEISQNWVEGVAGSWRTDPELSGGGQLYDTGNHLLDAVLWLTGLRPVSVAADMTFHDDAGRVDTNATMTVRFDAGTVGSVAVSGDAPRVRESIRIWTPDGGVHVTGKEWEERTVTFVDPDGTERTPHFDHFGKPAKVEAFVEAVREGDDPPATATDALRTTLLTEAAYESARSGERVGVDADDAW